MSKKQFPVRTTCTTRLRSLLTLLVLTLPAVVQAQFDYTTNNGTITIIGYTGPSGAVVIPDTINGLPVTSIGDSAFYFNFSLTSVTIPNSVTTIGNLAFGICERLTSVPIPNSVTNIGVSAFFSCTSLTRITIPNSVTSIGDVAFSYCTSLSAITVDALNSFYSSVDGVLFNKSQTLLIEYPGGKAGSYAVPDNVTSIANSAFNSCFSLTSVTIPNSVTNLEGSAFFNCASLTSVTIGNGLATIGDIAFYYCTRLIAVYFQGNAPGVGPDVFFNANNATVYYLPGTTGWGTTFGGRPTVLWNPLMQTGDVSFGVRTNRFGFTITGASNLVLVVEACTNLANPIWIPVGTNTLTGGSSYFNDPEWTNHPARFYRLRSP